MTGDGRWATPNLRGRQADHGKTTRRSATYPACVSQHAGLPDRHFSSTFIWRRRQRSALISCGAAELLSAHSGCNARLSKSAARKPASFRRFRPGSAGARVFWAFQAGYLRNPRQSGVCGQTPRKPLFRAGCRPAWPEKPVLRGLERWGKRRSVERGRRWSQCVKGVECV